MERSKEGGDGGSTGGLESTSVGAGEESVQVDKSGNMDTVRQGSMLS